MKLRWCEQGCVVLKSGCCDGIGAYNHHAECTCLEDLEAIRDDPDRLHMEGLVIRQRILGTHSTDLPTPIQYRQVALKSKKVLFK